MAQSGETQEQTEFFILNSQKVPKIPAEESSWSLQCVSSSPENNSVKVEDLSSCVVKRKSVTTSNWPPVDWKTAPGFPVDGLKTGAKFQGDCAENSWEKTDNCLNENSCEFNIEDQGAVLVEAEVPESQSNVPSNLDVPLESDLNVPLESVDLVSADGKDCRPSVCSGNDPVLAQQAVLTGRLGEHVAFKYFLGKVVERCVKWVNEGSETGLPYDIVLEGDENDTEYIEVKASRFGSKNWFLISKREWQFAIEKGESYSIAHVILAQDNMARLTIYQNPARLCQLGNLKLALVVPKH